MVLGLVAMAVFANTIPNNYALDDEYVTRNHPLTSQGIKAIPQIFTSHYYNNQIGNYFEYRPIVLASFAIEHTFFGDNPHVSHAINVLLYGITCMVLFFVIRSFQPEKNWLLPAVATLLFAAHPLHTEVVASIKNRDELFSFLFGICALLWALKYARGGRWQQYALFVLFILLSVISKRSVLSYAFIIPLAVSWFSTANLLRVMSLSFPLVLIVAFFSPIHEPQKNALLLVAIFMSPVFWSAIKNWPTANWSQPIQTVKGYFATHQTSASINLPYLRQGSTIFTIGLFLLIIASLLFLYLDLRTLTYLALLLATLGTGLLDEKKQHYTTAAILSAMVVTAASFGSITLVMVLVAPFAVGMFWMDSDSKMKGYIVFVTIIALLAHWYVQGQPDSVFQPLLALALLALHAKLRQQWVVPILFLAMAGLNVAYNPTYIPANLFYAGLAFYLSKRQLWHQFFLAACFTGITALFATTVLFDYPSNYTYQKHLGNYYAQLPDPYGDGVKTVTDIVPSAGREVHFVENPLVAEKRLSVKVATAGKVMAYYAGLMIFPSQLRYYYGFDQISVADFADPLAVLGWAAYVGLFVLALWLYKRDRLISFALLYLLLGLLFVSNLGVLLTGIVAERLVYGASLGFCLLVAAGLLRLFKKTDSSPLNIKQLKPAFGVVLVILFGLYAGRSVARNMDWKDALTLYAHDARISPRSAKVQQMAGYQYMAMAAQNPTKQGEYLALAEKYLQASLAIAPDFHTAMHNLGYVYSLRQDCANAIVYYERFIAVSPAPPDLTLQYGVCLDEQGRLTEAARQYEKFLSTDAYFLPVYTKLSYIYFRQGNLTKAIEVNRLAIERMPNEADPYINIGKTYLQLNQPKDAIAMFEKAQALKSNDIDLLLILAELHAQVGDPSRGQAYYNEALRLGYRPQ